MNFLIISALGNIVNHARNLRVAEQIVALLLNLTPNATYTIYER